MNKVNEANIAQIVIDATKAATWYWNVQTNELTINDRWAKMAGYSKEELSPISIDTWNKLVHPDDLEKSSRELDKLFHDEIDFYRVEVRMKHKKGHFVWILDSGKIVERDQEGKPLLVAGTHIDITENKEIQQKYKENEQFLTEIIENTKDIIYRLDLEGRFTYLSKGWHLELGQSVEKALYRSFKNYVHPDDLYMLELFFEDIEKSQSRQSISGYRLKHKNGSWRYYETNASPIKQNNIVIGYAGVAADITDKVYFQRALIEEKDHFEATILSVGDGVIVTDNQSIISKINDKAQNLTGYSEKESLGKNLHEIFKVTRNEDNAKLEDIVTHIVHTKKTMEIHNITLINKLGKILQIDDSAAPIFNLDNEVTGVVIVFRDVTKDVLRTKQIEYLSFHDQLTDFYNRHFLEEKMIDINKEDNYPLGIISIDINDLKKVNDTYGHLKGDFIIKEASRIIKMNTSRTDYHFRMGGDELLSIMPKSSKSELLSIKTKLKDDVSKICKSDCPLSLSYGFELLEVYTPNLYEGIKMSDKKMYEDKKNYKENTNT